MNNNLRISYKTSPAFPTFGSVDGIVCVWSDHSKKTFLAVPLCLCHSDLLLLLPLQ